MVSTLPTRNKTRDANLMRSNVNLRREVSQLYETVVDGFQAQKQRALDIKHNWKMWNCELDENQLYAGRNRLYAPLVYEAVKARITRTVNDLFPRSDRHVEVISQDGTLPRASLSVAEYYVQQMDLRSIISSLILNGDMEGQFNIYLSWRDSSRKVTYRSKLPVELDEGLLAGETDSVTEEIELSGCPHAEVLSDVDVCIFPSTATSLEDAIATGGGVAIVRRWTKRQIKDMIIANILDAEEGRKLLNELSTHNIDDSNFSESKLHAAGVKKDASGKWVLVYEVWTELEIDGEYRLCQIFVAGKYKTLAIRRNPLWCDLCPLISVSVERVAGIVKGSTPVTAVRRLQYYANDVLNEGADSATYSLLPLVLRDPAYQTSPIILAPAAILDVPPNGLQFAELPPLWQHAMQILGSLKGEIFQVLSVNPAMISQNEAKKPSQAEVAQMQQVDLLNTNDKSALLIGSVLDKVLTLIMGLDYQYREHDLFVRAFGEMGLQANMEQVPPFEHFTRYSYKWIGLEVTRSAQQMQEKIAALNIIKAVPPQMYPGYQLNLQPFVLDLTESVYGPRLGRLIFKDLRSQMSVDPTIEDSLMQLGHYVAVHPMDDIMQHMQVHRTSVTNDGDPFGMIAVHLQEHEMLFMQQQREQQAAMGVPGGQQGSPEAPEPGSVPQSPVAKGPPGMIHPDAMHDPSLMPRDVYQ